MLLKLENCSLKANLDVIFSGSQSGRLSYIHGIVIYCMSPRKSRGAIQFNYKSKARRMKLQPRILVFSPHPDDEVLGAGGFLTLAAKHGWHVKIVLVTKGELSIAENDPPDLRVHESREALTILGLNECVLEAWSYPDGSVPLSGPIIEDYRRVFKETDPDIVLLPAPTDNHGDHRRVTRGVLKALENGLNREVELRFYEILEPIQINHIENISQVFSTKKDALLCHASQIKKYNYPKNMDILSSMRGTLIDCKYGEGFLVFRWNGVWQNFFEQRPLISVIVRSSNDTFLSHALRSIIQQKYDQIEVIVVWYGEKFLERKSEFDILDLTVLTGQKQNSRGINLNLGISASRGDYISFLDEDDVWDSDHLSNLLSTLHSERNSEIAYTGYRIIQCSLDGDSVNRVKEISVHNEPYLPSRLLIENFIAINALLIRRQVFKTTLFAEDLRAYEDWLFLADAELNGFNFSHVDCVTAEYRIFGESLDEAHQNKAYQAMTSEVQRRILSKMKSNHLMNLHSLVKLTKNEVKSKEEDLKNRTDLLKAAEVKIKKLTKHVTEYQELKKRLIDIGQKLNIPGNKSDDILPALTVRGMDHIHKFSILMAVHDPPLEAFVTAIKSVRDQLYPNWEFCLVDDASSAFDVLSVIKKIVDNFSENSRIKFKTFKKNMGISYAFNQAADMATGEFLVLLDHDDWLHPEALLEAALAISSNQVKFLYTDSQTIDLNGNPIFHHCKPDWSPETLYYWNYINHLAIIERKLWQCLGGLRTEMDGVQDWDLYLRLSTTLKESEVFHISRPLYGWRAIETSTAYRIDAKPNAKEKWNPLLSDYHGRLQALAINKEYSKIKTDIKLNPQGPGFIIKSSPNITIKLQVVILTKDNPFYLNRCVESLKANTYPNMQITVVDNGSQSEEGKLLLNQLKDDGIHVIHADQPFNWSALNNLAVKNIDAKSYLFLNDDVEFQNSDVIQKMVNNFKFPKVGIVGCILEFPHGGIQHNGIILNPYWIANEVCEYGKFGELSSSRNVSAITGACMLIRKKLFDEIGGFNEQLPINYNDVDFSLSALSNGWRILVAADTRAIHYHMTTRGIDSKPTTKEMDYMKHRWKDRLEEKFYIKWMQIGPRSVYLKLKD